MDDEDAGRNHLATQHRERVVMQSTIRRQRRAGIDRAPPVEVRESPAGLLDEEHAGREIPGLEVDLDVELCLAFSHQTVAGVVAEAALAIGGVDQTDEAVPAARAAQEAEPGVDQVCLAEIADVRHANALAVEEGATTPARGVELAGHRVVDDADRDLARFLQRDQRRPHGDAADEVLRPVDGIDDEAAIARPALAELLAQEAVVREGAAKDFDDHLLGFAIRLRDRREIGLGRHGEAARGVLERDLAGGPRRFRGRFEWSHYCSGDREPGSVRGWPARGGRGSASSAGNGSPRSPRAPALTAGGAATTGVPPPGTPRQRTTAPCGRVAAPPSAARV